MKTNRELLDRITDWTGLEVTEETLAAIVFSLAIDPELETYLRGEVEGARRDAREASSFGEAYENVRTEIATLRRATR